MYITSCTVIGYHWGLYGVILNKIVITHYILQVTGVL